MKIQAGKYFVNSDSLGTVWITELAHNPKTNKEYEKRVSGYHNNLKSALVDMLQRGVFGSDTTTLEETINTIQKALDDAISIINNK